MRKPLSRGWLKSPEADKERAFREQKEAYQKLQE